ncbi:MAG: ATP-binding protein [bacterium]
MKFFSDFWTILIFFIALAFGITALAVYINFQLDQIVEVARAVRYGDLSKKVKSWKKGKIAQLAVNINKMIESLQDRENRIKQYQKEIQSQKEYLEAIFDSLADGIITISKKCRIIKINPIVSIWMGLNEEDITGKKLTDFLKCKCEVNCIEKSEEDISEICPLISQNERLSPTEAKIINLNSKTEKSLGLSSSPVAGVIGEPTYVIVLRDITELKKIEKIQKDFVATLTHDLRVPILAEVNTLKFFLEEKFGYLTDKQKQAIENMIESNNGLLELVNKLLDTYKYESGEGELYKEPTNIKKLIESCIAELLPLANKNNQTISDFIPEEIPILDLDKSEIKRVIINLINNAVTYTQKGGVITIDAEKNENYVIIKVSDNGKGISESELETIFDRFFSKAKKFRKIGTGLGLYLSKQIIEKHNGKIRVESKLGKGSAFYVSLPLR